MIENLAKGKYKTLENHTGIITVSLNGDLLDSETTVSVAYAGGKGEPNIKLSKTKTYHVINTTQNNKATITNHGPQAIDLSWKPQH